MAIKPKRPCGKVGCRNLTEERYCSEHQHLADQQKRDRHKHYDMHQRDQQAAKFYKSIEWDRVRRQALIHNHGLCQDCIQERVIKSADVVDHIKPIKLFWHLRLTISNLRSLCNRHHAIKTQEDRRKYGG